MILYLDCFYYKLIMQHEYKIKYPWSKYIEVIKLQIYAIVIIKWILKILYLYKEVSQNVEEANAWDIFGNRIQGLAQKVLNWNSWN